MSATPSFATRRIEPQADAPHQLFILLHGVGANGADLLPLAQLLHERFPQSALLLPDGGEPFDGGGAGRQWFSLAGVDEDNRPARVAQALPGLEAWLRGEQARYGLSPADTAVVGFSQGAIMGMELAVRHPGSVGRVLAFAGRFAALPEQAPPATTFHLLHGELDPVIPVAHAQQAYQRLQQLDGDATIDIGRGIGHELHPALVEQAITRLQTCVPLRLWKSALLGQ